MTAKKPKTVHRISRATLFPLVRKLFRFKYSGLESLPDSNCIFASNHQSGIDLFLLATIIVPHTNRKLCVMLHKNFFMIPLINIMFMKWEAISVDPNDPAKRQQAIERCVEKLRQGHDALIFPEGLVQGGMLNELLRAHTGVVRAAIKARKKVVPVGITGSYRAWRFPHTFPRNPLSIFFLDFSQKITIKFGRAIDFGKHYGLDLDKDAPDTRKTLRKLTTQLMCEIGKLAGQEYKHDRELLK